MGVPRLRSRKSRWRSRRLCVNCTIKDHQRWPPQELVACCSSLALTDDYMAECGTRERTTTKMQNRTASDGTLTRDDSSSAGPRPRAARRCEPSARRQRRFAADGIVRASSVSYILYSTSREFVHPSEVKSPAASLARSLSLSSASAPQPG